MSSDFSPKTINSQESIRLNWENVLKRREEEEKKNKPFLKYSKTDLGVTITGFANSPTALTIPVMIDALPVTAIGDSAFKDCESLTSVTIPEGVTAIGDSAFYECESLTSVTIPKGVTTIGDPRSHSAQV